LGNGHNIERDAIKASSIATIVGQNVLERWTKSLLDLGNVGSISNVCTLHRLTDWLEKIFGSILDFIFKLVLFIPECVIFG